MGRIPVLNKAVQEGLKKDKTDEISASVDRRFDSGGG